MDANVFKSNEGFGLWLRGQVTTEPYKTIYAERCKLAATGPHFTTDEVCEYVLGMMDDKQEQTLLKHIVYCPMCSEQVSETEKVSGFLDDQLADFSMIN